MHFIPRFWDTMYKHDYLLYWNWKLKKVKTYNCHTILFVSDSRLRALQFLKTEGQFKTH